MKSRGNDGKYRSSCNAVTPWLSAVRRLRFPPARCVRYSSCVKTGLVAKKSEECRVVKSHRHTQINCVYRSISVSDVHETFSSSPVPPARSPSIAAGLQIFVLARPRLVHVRKGENDPTVEVPSRWKDLGGASINAIRLIEFNHSPDGEAHRSEAD